MDEEVPASRSNYEKSSSTSEWEVPEGGLRAWLVIAGAFLDLFSTFGLVNSYVWGIPNALYIYNPGCCPPAVIALIGSLQLFLLYFLSPIVGRIFDIYGSKVLLPLGTLLTPGSMMLLSICKDGSVYQFFLCHGILFGIGNAIVFTPALAVVGHWFKRKRAYCIGLVSSGSALGGVIYPLMLQKLIPKIGFGWAVRIAAFLTFFCLSISSVTIRARLPVKPKKRLTLKECVDLTGFRDSRYCLSAVGAFLSFYALFIPFFYIQEYAEFEGVSPKTAKYLLSITNALGIPSRILPGIIADKFGSLNTLIPSTVLTSVLVFAVWLPSRGFSSIAAFSSLYGLFSGGFISLLPAYIATISPTEKFGGRLGSIYMVVGVANLVGTPTAGAFLHEVNQTNFNGLIAFCGCMIFSTAFAYGIARFIHSKRILAIV
ncbi:major facilitator superfamily domain-containing protein [Abortiporus biennis]|nr:major facilitator superfamily domain-containing protein [Abortiporus biennis]